MKRIVVAVTMAGAMALAGCNMLNKPSSDMMAKCLVASGARKTFNIPLSALPEWASSRGVGLIWKHGEADQFTVSFRPKDAPSMADHEIAVELRSNDVRLTDQNCSGGQAIITAIAVDGERLDQSAMLALSERLLEMLRDHAAGTNAAANPLLPSAAPSTSDVEQPAPADETSLDQEAEADGQYHAQQAELALKSPIQVTDDLTTYSCCMTLRTIVDDFARRGAKPTITTADSGTVWLEVKDPTGGWQGWTDIELEFARAYPGNNILVLSSIKDRGREVANVNEAGAKSTNNLLRQRYRLKDTQEPTS